MGPLTDSEKQLIIQMKESGFLLKDIVVATNRNPITIRRYLTSQGYPMSNPRLSREEQERIVFLFESGLSCSEIARQTNRSSNGINHFLASKGYDTSSPFVITEKERQIAIEVFQTTNSCAEAARAIGHSHDGVWSMLKREGFDTRKSIYTWLSDEQVALVRAMYMAGYTAAEILPLLDGKIITENSVIKIVRDGGITPRKTGYRNIILHEDFFDTIDAEEKAYVIGFLMADGYVIEQKRGRTNTWGITLQTQDKYMLEKFRDLVGCDNELGHSRNEYVFIAASQHMVDALSKYNIIPRKCKVVSFPYNTIPKCFYRHVVRGIFDGDGCICGRSCSFTGNETLVSQIQMLIHQDIDINLTKVHETKPGVWRFAFSSKKDIAAFYHYLYDDATIYLTRKRDRFEELPFIYAQAA